MNDQFVNIKVDREERPDLDEIYMNAVQMLTGRGGWPMTVFLTPERKPFYGGTYFPPEDRGDMPGFPRILMGVNQAFRERPAGCREKRDAYCRRSTAHVDFRRDRGNIFARAIIAEGAAKVARLMIRITAVWVRRRSFLTPESTNCFCAITTTQKQSALSGNGRRIR